MRNLLRIPWLVMCKSHRIVNHCFDVVVLCFSFKFFVFYELMVEFTYHTPNCFVLTPFCFHKPTVIHSIFFFKIPNLFTTSAPLQIEMENVLLGFPHKKKIYTHYHSIKCIEKEKKKWDQMFEQLHDIWSSPFCFQIQAFVICKP